MHKKFIRKRIKTAKNAKEVKGIQKNFNRNAKGMHQNFRGSSQENIAIVVQTKYDEKMACLMNFFWNYAAVPLHCSCSFYRIEFFSKIDSNLIKQRKHSSHVHHFSPTSSLLLHNTDFNWIWICQNRFQDILTQLLK